jgi:hypothetical protein
MCPCENPYPITKQTKKGERMECLRGVASLARGIENQEDLCGQLQEDESSRFTGEGQDNEGGGSGNQR